LNNSKITYDVIILNHVVEHFSDFNDSISKILNHLKYDGLLYIGVPNIENFSKFEFQIPHVYYFTINTLNYYTSKLGLEIIDSGSDENIHMYAIYRKTEKKSNPVFNQYDQMIKKIRIYKIRQPRIYILEILHIKRFLMLIILKISRS
jgi:2-polyprenyl-3-methyl-5-hydroxy-6-metoxy-1,4-benzoquinol methylase